jgi:wyosine [tRNA(Phe)-imidazoG37] synthetase (radical SAM superfamily)
MHTNYTLFAKCIPSGDCLRCPIGGRAVVYGPFTSRRRGASIGINLFPLAKTCSFNCVYCFRGETRILTVEPRDDGSNIASDTLRRGLEEAISSLRSVTEDIDAIDFSGSGEPTLHPRFPELINVVKAFAKELGSSVSVGLFTNSTTLSREAIARAIQKLDYIEAKLDTVDPIKFRAVNLPHPAITLPSIIEGLKRVRKVFGGELAVQIMLLRYRNMANYGEADAITLAEKLTEIEPDRINIYTVYRTPRLKCRES